MKKTQPVERQIVSEKPQKEKQEEIKDSRELKELLEYVNTGERQIIFNEGFQFLKEDLAFHQERLNEQEAVFLYKDEKKRIYKEFIFDFPHSLFLNIEIENNSPETIRFDPSLLLGNIRLDGRGFDQRFKEVFVQQENSILRQKPAKEGIFSLEDGEFFGWRDRYFCALIVPQVPDYKFEIVKIAPNIRQLRLILPEINVHSGQSGHLSIQIYLGEQNSDFLKEFKNGAEQIIYFGFWDPISKLLLKILGFFQSIVRNWGFAIVLLSIFIYLLLFPLTLKQLRSTKEMQQLQPKIEELRKNLKNNPQKLNKAVLELYKEHKVNPLGGCLPMVLQIPVFFALYQALMRSAQIRGAHFLWIQDLSKPDCLIKIPNLGQLNILPIVMAIVMFLQQKFSLSTMSGPAKEQQKMMLFLFPLIFGFIFYNMPSGLVLYWLINSTMMLINQSKIHRIQKCPV